MNLLVGLKIRFQSTFFNKPKKKITPISSPRFLINQKRKLPPFPAQNYEFTQLCSEKRDIMRLLANSPSQTLHHSINLVISNS